MRQSLPPNSKDRLQVCLVMTMCHAIAAHAQISEPGVESDLAEIRSGSMASVRDVVERVRTLGGPEYAAWHNSVRTQARNMGQGDARVDFVTRAATTLDANHAIGLLREFALGSSANLTSAKLIIALLDLDISLTTTDAERAAIAELVHEAYLKAES